MPQLEQTIPRTITARSSTIDQVADYLAAGIESGEYSDGDQLPSRSVLAEQFGLSPAAVSIALKRLANKHPLKFVAGKGVFISSADRETGVFTLGFIGNCASQMAETGMVDGYHGRPVLEHLVEAATEKSAAVLVIPDTRKEPLDIDHIQSFGADCILSFEINPSVESIIEFRKRGMPFIIVGQPYGYLDELGASFVYFDTIGAIRQAVRLFAERGHERIAYVLTVPSMPTAAEAWRDTFYAETASLGFNCAYKDYCRIIPRERRKTEEQTLQSIRDETIALLDLPEPPTAVFYSFFPHSITDALQAAAERGVGIGADLSVLCKWVEGETESCPFSALYTRPKILGRELVSTAIELAHNHHRPVRKYVPLKFVDHGSILTL